MEKDLWREIEKIKNELYDIKKDLWKEHDDEVNNYYELRNNSLWSYIPFDGKDDFDHNNTIKIQQLKNMIKKEKLIQKQGWDS